MLLQQQLLSHDEVLSFEWKSLQNDHVTLRYSIDSSDWHALLPRKWTCSVKKVDTPSRADGIWVLYYTCVVWSLRVTFSQYMSTVFPYLCCIPASWQEFLSLAFMFSKIANFVLFSRQDIRLGVLYLVLCLGERSLFLILLTVTMAGLTLTPPLPSDWGQKKYWKIQKKLW